MANHGTITAEDLVRSSCQLAKHGPDDLVKRLIQTEPALYAYLWGEFASIAGRMSITGVPTLVVQGAAHDMFALMMTCLDAIQRAQYRLWADTLPNTPLGRLRDAGIDDGPQVGEADKPK